MLALLFMQEDAMTRDEVSPTKEHQMLALLQQISLAVAEADTINTAYREVLAHICRFMDWPLGHIYVWSGAVQALVSSRVWYTVDAALNVPFRALSEATQFKRDEGTMGQVWEKGKAIYILDVQNDPHFVRQMTVAEGGIRAYFAFPVIVDDEITAVLEFFSPQSTAPDQDMTSVINHVSALLGLAIQRQQTLDHLRQSEAQLAEAQRTAHVGHWEWDIIHNQITWSSELYRIYGLPEEGSNVTYEAFIERIHPDDLPYVQKKVTDAHTNGRSFDYFHRIIRPNGAVRVVQARGRPSYDQAGHIIKLHGTAQDMTEQKEAEIKLAHLVRQLSALMEIGQAVSATHDLSLIYERMLTLVRPLINAEALIIFLKQGDQLEVVAMDQENAPDMLGTHIPLDSGIAGAVWQSGRPIFLQGEDCIKQLSPRLIALTAYQPEAILAVPIRWQDKAVGVLEAAHRQANTFDHEALRLLETAAAWTAIAIGNARQYQQLQRRLQESNAILAVSNALTETFNLDKLLQLIVNRAQDIIQHADWTTIHLLQPKTQKLELAARTGLAIDADDYLINPDEGLAGQVMIEGCVINAPDVQIDPRRLPIDVSLQARSLLIAPVESQQRRIGVISVQCATPNVFTPSDERLLTIMGVQAGLAIENARLYAVQEMARKRAEKQRERMRHMARRVVQAQEKERARIARELHDESGQALTSLKISLDLIRSMLPEEMTDIKESLTEVLTLTDKTMSNLRLLSHNLRPPGLDAYGLDAALTGLCQDFDTHTQLSIVYSGTALPDLASLTALSLYRFAQEAMTNAIKHAEATEVQMALSHDSNMITLVIADNGRGFVPPDLEESVPAQGAGLLGMMERLEMVDGRLSIESIVGEGSRLTAVVPYTKEEL